MKARILTIALGCVALAAAPAFAQHGGGHGGGGPHGGGMGASGGMSGRDFGVGMRTEARVNSQGPMNAADRALERANANSVLSGTTRTTLRTHARHMRLTTSHGYTTRALARRHSRGPLHASARARARANANSVLSGSATTTIRRTRGR